MSDELFEIAFSGQIAEGEDLQSAMLKVGQVFKADENRLAQMFSGRRVIIKREADAATVAKYQAAFSRAGAVCEIKSLSVADEPRQTPVQSSQSTSTDDDQPYVSRYPESDQVPQALLSDPLGVSGGAIEDLSAEMAPVGSQMQHQIQDVPDAVIDTSGIDVAPVGSDLSEAKKEASPPPPDTSGLSMED